MDSKYGRTMSSVLVTGANGFVGEALCEFLAVNDMHVRAATRNEIDIRCEKEDNISVGEIDGNTDWEQALKDIDCVVHLAARVHVMNEAELKLLADETFLVSDGKDLSTSDLIKSIASGIGKSPYLIPVSPRLLNIGVISLEKKLVARRLLGSLQVDSSKVRRVLGWSPPPIPPKLR